jgi:cytochrome c556
MNRKIFVGLVFSALCLSWTMGARAEEFTRKTYVQSVIDILHLHADLLHNLAVHRTKYSDNLVRHAIAIQRTFGLLGPMSWHAAESARLMKETETESGMDAEKFDELANRSRDAMKALVHAAHDAMEEDDREGIDVALENLKSSCNACHAYLPESVAPDVWGNLKRK